MDKPERDEKGRIKPGQASLNPGGKPKAIREALDAFRQPSDLKKLRERLVYLALNADDERVSVAAIKEFHDRAYGKPPQALTGDDGKPLSVGVLILPPEDAKDGG